MLRQAHARARSGPPCGPRWLNPAHDGWRAWAPVIALGAALTCAYYLAAQLGVALMSETEHVAVLWPASGVAVGVLMALGRRARAPVTAGVLVATVAVNLEAGRAVWAAFAFGLCNAGEALLAAWLVKRWCGRQFKFDDWRGLCGFLAAAVLAPVAAAFVAAVVMQQLYAVGPLLHIWRVWAAADALGIIIVAPVLVGLYHLAAEPMARQEAFEGTAAIVLVAATSSAIFGAPPGSALAETPPAVLFPLLLWIAARCRPVFAAVAAAVVAAVLIGTTTFRIGDFSGLGVAVNTVQLLMLIGSLCILSLSALFAERRRNEAALRESNERLQLALGGAELGVWSVDLGTGAMVSDERDVRINRHDPDAPPRTLAEARRSVHPDDLQRLDAAFAAARQTGAPCRAEYRVLVDGGADPSHARWVAMEGSVVRDANGRPVRLLGVTRDITERKRAEEALAERTAQLALAGRAGLVGSYSYERASAVLQISAGFAAIYGLREGTTEMSRADWLARVHPDDVPGFEMRRARIFKDRQREMLLEYRILRPDGEVRWIEQRSLITYDDTGAMRRIAGVQIDMTERKRDEEHKSLLVAELDHRVKNVLAVVSALLARSRDAGGSVPELVAALDGRIKSMAIAHELLSCRKWDGLALGKLIERELEPYAGSNDLAIGGPAVVLKAEAGQALAMVVHELVTNAAKYGALSVEGGRVSVRWQLVANGSAAHLELDWQESGGPAVAPSGRVGYGTSVIRDLIPYEVGGQADLAFPPEGVRCRLQIPAKWLSGPVRAHLSRLREPHGLSADRKAGGGAGAACESGRRRFP